MAAETDNDSITFECSSVMKERARKMAKAAGLTLSSAMRIMLARYVEENIQLRKTA